MSVSGSGVLKSRDPAEGRERETTSSSKSKSKCLTLFPTCCDFKWKYFREKGPLWQTLTLAFLEVLVWVLIRILDPLGDPENEQQELLELINDNIASASCLSQWISEYFLPLQEFWVFKGVLGAFCMLSGVLYGFTRFRRWSHILLEAFAIVFTTIIMHLLSITYIRGAQQHAANVERRAKREDPPVKLPKFLEAGGCLCSTLGRWAKIAVALLSPKRAKTALHCSAIVLLKILQDYLDIATDVAAGVLFLYGASGDGTATSLPPETQWGAGVTILVFSTVGALCLAIEWSVPDMKERLCVWVYTGQVTSEVGILCATGILTAGTWNELEKNELDKVVAVLNLLLSALGIPLGLLKLFVNGADAEFNKVISSVGEMSRRVSHRLRTGTGGRRCQESMPSVSMRPEEAEVFKKLEGEFEGGMQGVKGSASAVRPRCLSDVSNQQKAPSPMQAGEARRSSSACGAVREAEEPKGGDTIDDLDESDAANVMDHLSETGGGMGGEGDLFGFERIRASPLGLGKGGGREGASGRVRGRGSSVPSMV
uniref:Uncharacterized protein n=1 Tax=Chromera velia CCMP2878 TaxID=1169474 RepID=A0A0G4HM48_9ALVE|eukprot:Cvel_7434.t1-p1 / transcript=Cvel_7434.t1 / gene=Cvel_7434 / organism=Chromera_velia_CCMP2878 / gene_product=hypothetical protein / transcript_product=hypothetical protein / location=Cvel_scaffold388:64594-66631(+) / protein_length=540 / sequence_SO=supercontig / SO=protein_coding / is_pseudo=false